MWRSFPKTRQHAGYILSACGLLFILTYLTHLGKPFASPLPAPLSDDETQRELSTLRRVCSGPRGLLSAGSEDLVRSRNLNITFPTPIGGSFETLGLTTELNTPATRYGAYGYGEDAQDYNYRKVNWAAVDWAELQNACRLLNQDRFRGSRNVSTARTLQLRQGKAWWPQTLKPRVTLTHRTAIVIRAWQGFKWTQYAHHHLRALITEAGLASNGDYTIFLLFDVHDKNYAEDIFHDDEAYRTALEELVHPDYQSIAVLFNQEVLKSWYPNIPEHSVFFQVYQPLQLFAQFFPDFDHYWQLEMDIRFTGDARLLLDSMSNFARDEPRKQSIERASYYYMPAIHGSWDDFRDAIDASLPDGGLWGPINIPDIPHPIGPPPPVFDPRNDPFSWGVGEDADIVLTNALANVSATAYWPFKGWVHKFALGEDTPRFYSNVAMGRYSWNLLNAMHHAQSTQGLALPSEASPVSFALYHGLKVSFPPLPWYHHPQADREVGVEELNELYNGKSFAENARLNNGLSYGKALYDPNGAYELFNGKTWWWVPGFPGRIMRQWLRQEKEGVQDVLREVEGEVWAPSVALHPVKQDDLVW